jgi:hypothetical protein
MRPFLGLRVEQSVLTAWEKSAEGIVVKEVTLMRDWKRAVKCGGLTRRRPERYEWAIEEMLHEH